MQEFSNNQLKYSMRINWLYGIYSKDSSIFYVNCIGYILYISKTYNQLYTHTHIHVHRHTFFFFSESWLLTTYQLSTAPKYIYLLVITSLALEQMINKL